MKQIAVCYLGLSFTMVIWGLVPIALKHLSGYLSALEITTARYASAAGMLVVILVLSQHNTLQDVVARRWKQLCVLGFLVVPVNSVALNVGVARIPASVASLLIATSPGFIYLFSLLLGKEAISQSKLAGLATSFVGLYLTVTSGCSGRVELGYWPGVAAAAMAPISWALYSVLANSWFFACHGLTVVAGALAFGSLPMLLTIRPSLLSNLVDLPSSGWLALCFVSLLGVVFGFVAYTEAVNRIGASRAGVFMYFVPVVTIVLSRWLVGEAITMRLAIGGSLVLSGVYVVNRSGTTGQTEKEARTCA